MPNFGPCKTCFFWRDNYQPLNDIKFGICKVNSPTRISGGWKQGGGTEQATTSENTECGQWEPKEKETVTPIRESPIPPWTINNQKTDFENWCEWMSNHNDFPEVYLWLFDSNYSRLSEGIYKVMKSLYE